MNRKATIACRWTIAAAAILAVQLAYTNATAQESVRRALLIGINEYAASDLPDLRGAVNDTVLMRQVLVTRYGFSPRDIKVLTDAQATREAILSSLRELVAAAGPRDVVYIHYSGHGSQVEDFSGDENEQNGMDETIVPHDGRTGDVADITDDELGEIIGRLETREAVIVLDSCHSGTGTRSSKVIPRSIPNDNRTGLYRRQGEIGTRGEVLLDWVGHILLTGAPANQNALDGPVDGDYRGFFSYALAKVMDKLGPGATPSDIHTGVNGIYQTIQDELGILLPDPQFEASREDLASAIFPSLLGQETGPAAARTYVEVEPLDSRRVRLLRGATLGASPDSYWAIYPPGERDFRPGGGLATAQVTSYEGRHALAALIDNPQATIRRASRAIRIVASPPSARVPVELRARPEDASRLRAAIGDRLGDVQFVGPDDFARFIVDVASMCQGCGTEVVVSGADGLQELSRFPWAGAEDAALRLAPLFRRSVDASAISRLTNPSSGIDLSARMVSMGTRGITVVPPSETGRFRIRRAGEPRSHANSLMLEIRTNCDCYLTIVDIDPEGRVGLLFPNAYSDRSGFHRDGFVSAGRTVRLPDSLDEPNDAGFYWDYSPPAGVDTVQVFASTDLENARKIREHISRVGAEVGTRGKEPIAELRNEFAMLSRGISTVPSSGPASAALPDWTSLSLHIRIDP